MYPFSRFFKKTFLFAVKYFALITAFSNDNLLIHFTQYFCFSIKQLSGAISGNIILATIQEILRKEFSVKEFVLCH